MIYYIIEHPASGVLCDIEYSNDGVFLGWFSRSAGWADVGVLRFYNFWTVRNALADLPASVRDVCVIRISGTWDVVA